MTINNKKTYTTDSSINKYIFDFPIFDKYSIKVFLDGQELNIDFDYYVKFTNEDNEGYIYLLNESNNQKLILLRDNPISRKTDFISNNLNTKALEYEINNMLYNIEDIKVDLDKVIDPLGELKVEYATENEAGIARFAKDFEVNDPNNTDLIVSPDQVIEKLSEVSDQYEQEFLQLEDLKDEIQYIEDNQILNQKQLLEQYTTYEDLIGTDLENSFKLKGSTILYSEFPEAYNRLPKNVFLPSYEQMYNITGGTNEEGNPFTITQLIQSDNTSNITSIGMTGERMFYRNTFVIGDYIYQAWFSSYSSNGTNNNYMYLIEYNKDGSYNDYYRFKETNGTNEQYPDFQNILIQEWNNVLYICVIMDGYLFFINYDNIVNHSLDDTAIPYIDCNIQKNDKLFYDEETEYFFYYNFEEYESETDFNNSSLLSRQITKNLVNPNFLPFSSSPQTDPIVSNVSMLSFKDQQEKEDFYAKGASNFNSRTTKVSIDKDYIINVNGYYVCFLRVAETSYTKGIKWIILDSELNIYSVMDEVNIPFSNEFNFTSNKNNTDIRFFTVGDYVIINEDDANNNSGAGYSVIYKSENNSLNKKGEYQDLPTSQGASTFKFIDNIEDVNGVKSNNSIFAYSREFYLIDNFINGYTNKTEKDYCAGPGSAVTGSGYLFEGYHPVIIMGENGKVRIVFLWGKSNVYSDSTNYDTYNQSINYSYYIDFDTKKGEKLLYPDYNFYDEDEDLNVYFKVKK